MWLVDLKKLFVTSVKVWRRCAGTRHSNKNTLQLRGQPDVSFPPRMHGFSCNVALSIYESTTPLECSCHESTGCPSAFAKVYIGLRRHRIRPVQSPAFTQARLTVHQSAIKPSWCAGRGQIMHHELHDRKIRIAADSVQADNHAILPVHPPPPAHKNAAGSPMMHRFAWCINRRLRLTSRSGHCYTATSHLRGTISRLRPCSNHGLLFWGGHRRRGMPGTVDPERLRRCSKSTGG